MGDSGKPLQDETGSCYAAHRGRSNANRQQARGFKGNSCFVFSTTNGERPFSGFSKAKRSLDDEIAAKRKKLGQNVMPRWTLHDLRRTGRSLMSRAKVPSDHAERVMGHVMGGVRETYDRYEYLEEKRDALDKLSVLLGEIVSPQPSVIQMVAA